MTATVLLYVCSLVINFYHVIYHCDALNGYRLANSLSVVPVFAWYNMNLFLMNNLLQPCDKVSKIIIIVKIEYREVTYLKGYVFMCIHYDVDL